MSIPKTSFFDDFSGVCGAARNDPSAGGKDVMLH